MRHASLILIVGALGLSRVFGADLQAQTPLPEPIDQARVAEDLVRGTARERALALAKAEALPPDYVQPTLRKALLTALENQTKVEALRFERFERGDRLADQEDPEFIAAVARVVANLRDPTTIAALTGTLGLGVQAVEDALVEFGEAAVPSVVATARSSPSNYAIDDAMMILRHLVEESDKRPLSEQARAQIRGVTKLRLTTPARMAKTGLTLRNAIDLAAVQTDPDLKETIRRLASDREAVKGCGVTEERGVSLTMKLASARLAGRMPQPRSHVPRK